MTDENFENQIEHKPEENMPFSAIPGYEKKDRSKEYITLAIIIVIVVAMLAVLAFFGIRIWKDMTANGGLQLNFLQGNEKEPSKNGNSNGSAGGKSNNNENSPQQSPGSGDIFTDVVAFESEDVTYTIEAGLWELQEENEKGKLDFQINYPIISGLSDTGVQEKLNSEIESIASDSKDLMYPEPTDNIKNVIGEDAFRLESIVDYKISYMDENYISIIFRDHYFLGSVYAEYADLRTVTYDLKTGEIIELKDFVDISKDFIQDFRVRMISEDPTSNVFIDEEIMSDENMIRILSGEVLEGRYLGVFFLSANGVDAGITYHYRSTDSNIIERGYVTTLYSFDDIRVYAKTHSIWDVLKIA